MLTSLKYKYISKNKILTAKEEILVVVVTVFKGISSEVPCVISYE